MKNLLHRFKMPAFFFIVLFICMSNVSQAQITYNWSGASDNNWNNIANWAESTVPTNIDLFNMSAGKPNYPILTSSVTCGRIANMGGGSISATGAGSLTFGVTGSSAISGTFTISCPIIFSGNITFSISGSNILTLSGPISGSGGIIKTSSGHLVLGTTTVGTLTNNSSANTGRITLGGLTTINTLLAVTRGFIEIGANTLVLKGNFTRGASAFLRGSQSSNVTVNSSLPSRQLYFDPSYSELNNLTLNNTVSSTTTFFNDIAFYGGVTFNSAFDILDFSGVQVTLKSNALGTAYIGEIKGQLNNADDVVVERYIDCGIEFTGKRAWRLMSFPVTVTSIRDAWCGIGIVPNADASNVMDADPNLGTIITGHGFATGAAAEAQGYDWFQGLSPLTTSSIRYFTPSTGWPSATNTPDITVAPDKEGYMLYVRGDRGAASNSAKGFTVLRPTGTLKQGTITVPVADNYTVVGNPYASPINLDVVYNNTGNSAVIKPNFWVWDATLGGAGAYRILSGDGNGGYSMTGGGGVAADYLVVNSSQAFFVEKEGAGGDITIEENDKVATITPPVMFRPTGTTGAGVSKLDIKLFQAAGSTVGLQADGVVGRYHDIYSVSPYETYDAAKMNNFNENLSLVRNGRYMSIESRPYPTQKDTLFISFWGLKNRDYAFTISSTMFAGINQTALLIDNFTNTQTILDMNDGAVTYPFSVNSNVASSSLNRFLIVMAPATVLPVTFTKINASLIGSKVQVSWATGSELGVKNYSVERSADGTNFNKIGEVAAINAANGASYQFADNQPLPANNYYRIRSNDADGKYAFSSIAAVQLNGKKGMQVMPTVISNQRFTLALNNQPAGNYQLKITNTAGQQVYQKMINNMGGNNTQVIELGNTAMPTGVYNLSVSGLNGSNQNFRLLIQN